MSQNPNTNANANANANTNTNSSNSNVIPVSELYWSLVDKADKKFSKIRDLPYYQRNSALVGFPVNVGYLLVWNLAQKVPAVS